MIPRRRISYSSRQIGAFLILLSTFSASSAWSTDEEALRIRELRELSGAMEKTGDTFGAFLFGGAYYHLEQDTSAKLQAGLRLVDLCFSANRYEEAERTIGQLLIDFPNDGDLKDYLLYQFGRNLTLAGLAEDANGYLRQVDDAEEFRNPALLLEAYNHLRVAQPNEATQRLHLIEAGSAQEVVIRDAVLEKLSNGPRFQRRHAPVAIGLSAILPGLGQAYSGHHFDALQSLLFNLIIGGSTYLSWRYEVWDRDHADRNYSLPVISSTVFSVLYLANLWNAGTSASRYNRYHELQHYRRTMALFELRDGGFSFYLNVPFRRQMTK